MKNERKNLHYCNTCKYLKVAAFAVICTAPYNWKRKTIRSNSWFEGAQTDVKTKQEPNEKNKYNDCTEYVDSGKKLDHSVFNCLRSDKKRRLICC